MNSEQLNQLLANYKEGVPVKVETSTVVMLCVAALITVTLGAGIVKIIKQL